MKKRVLGFALLVGCAASFDNNVDQSLVGEAACDGVAAEAGDLLAAPKNLDSTAGLLRGLLFDAGSGFPGENEKAVASVTLDLGAGETCFVFSDLEPGKEYAVSLLHDEDENGDMTTNFVGAPKEGYGTSRNAPPEGTSPPAYEKAKFTFSNDEQLLLIPIRY